MKTYDKTKDRQTLTKQSLAFYKFKKLICDDLVNMLASPGTLFFYKTSSAIFVIIFIFISTGFSKLHIYDNPRNT